MQVAYTFQLDVCALLLHAWAMNWKKFEDGIMSKMNCSHKFTFYNDNNLVVLHMRSNKKTSSLNRAYTMETFSLYNKLSNVWEGERGEKSFLVNWMLHYNESFLKFVCCAIWW